MRSEPLQLRSRGHSNVHSVTCKRCRESDNYIKSHWSDEEPSEYICQNGLRDIGVPITVAGQHLATLFLGQFFYEGEVPDRDFFLRQAREFGFDQEAYLAAFDRVPVFRRELVENVIAYNKALARFISDLAERAVVHARDEETLREAHRRKDEFLAALSHELRGPLAPIQNALYVLGKADPASKPATRAREAIGRQVQHLTRLVDDLLDVTRIERGKVRLRRRQMDFVESVRTAVEDHKPTYARRRIALELRCPIEPVWVKGDTTRLSQVVSNLLQNSAKFTNAGGHVLVSVERSGKEAVLRIQDDGVGMEPDLLRTLSDELSRVLADVMEPSEAGAQLAFGNLRMGRAD